jgi:hypothetical protein
MRFLLLFVLVVLSPLPAAAQGSSQSTEAPNVTVIESTWRKDVYIPALYDDPMRVNDEQAELAREQKITVQQNAVRIQQGNNPRPLPVHKPSGDNIPLGEKVIYQYQTKIKNTGSKTINAIEWEYLLFDPDTEVEVGHHRFRHTIKVRPGKTATLTTLTGNPPTAVIPANKAADVEPKYSERVVISRIEYNDGSSWQRPAN